MRAMLTLPRDHSEQLASVLEAFWGLRRLGSLSYPYSLVLGMGSGVLSGAVLCFQKTSCQGGRHGYLVCGNCRQSHGGLDSVRPLCLWLFIFLHLTYFLNVLLVISMGVGSDWLELLGVQE